MEIKFIEEDQMLSIIQVFDAASLGDRFMTFNREPSSIEQIREITASHRDGILLLSEILRSGISLRDLPQVRGAQILLRPLPLEPRNVVT